MPKEKTRVRERTREKQSERVDVSLEYKGPGVKGGRMDGRVVAQEILGFCDFATLAGQVAYGRDINVQPEVRGFRGKSFDIDFVLGILGPTATLLSLHPSSPRELLILIKDSVALWKHLRGQKPKSTERAQRNQNQIQIENNIGSIQVVNIETLNLVADPAASQAVQNFVVKPLDLAGVKSVDIVSKQMKGTLASVASNETQYFVPLDMDRPLLETEHDTGLVVDSPSFREGNKWRFFDGQASFTASIEDEGFLRGVDDGSERFGKGDVLVVKMRVRQVRTADGGLKAERTVVKVKEHKVAQKQFALIDRD
jgi:hypothetical protein